jgi:hypothetical protein
MLCLDVPYASRVGAESEEHCDELYHKPASLTYALHRDSRMSGKLLGLQLAGQTTRVSSFA